jgi:hypothetical protein
MLLIYTHKTTNRSRFILHFIFRDVLGLQLKITNDVKEFNNYNDIKISYSSQPIADELFFQSRNLLFETGISEQNITVFDFKNTKAFFATGKLSAMPFDIFSAAFYLVSRYEEYLPHIRDVHDRFDAKESLAFNNNFLHQPVVDSWAIELKNILKQKFPQHNFPNRSYKYISTIDIDNAFAYKEKGLIRTMGGYLRALKDLDIFDLRERTAVLLGKKTDPYDTYSFQNEIKKKYSLSTIYFFLLADYGVNDKNVPVHSHKFQSLIKSISDHSEIGIHPSYGSNSKPEKLKKEISRLSVIIHSEIIKSRQHFLKLVFPDTYRNLIENDIKEDYSMGFASVLGFRAGTCTPFHFYDLDMELETKLKIYPFAVMDATLRYYLKINAEDALKHIKAIIDETKKVDGLFISLWHNESLSNNRHWNGWAKVYEEMVKEATA